MPYDILIEDGHALISKFTASLAYDTRNSTTLPNHGQRTEFIADLAGGPLGGDRSFYKLELKSAWYFKGIFKGDVIEMTGHAGVVEGFDGGHAPFYERFYLGGLSTLRGYQYRGIGPRETGFTEPIGGNTYWYGSAEYSIPIFQQEKGPGVRVAFFYDIGSVQAKSYDFSSGQFSHDYGVGLRLNLPIGPLRLDYGIPINHDNNTGNGGKFQFGVGYTREF